MKIRYLRFKIESFLLVAIFLPCCIGIINAAETGETFEFGEISAVGGQAEAISIGSTEEESGFKFQLDLTSKGAAVNTASLSEYNDLNRKKPKPLKVLSPIEETFFSMANGRFIFVEQAKFVDLGRLNWDTSKVIDEAGGSQKVSFEAFIRLDGIDSMKLTKTYKVEPDSYLVDCDMQIENLSENNFKIRFDMQGPGGIAKEDIRMDSRTVAAAFVGQDGRINAAKWLITKLEKKPSGSVEPLDYSEANYRFMWASIANKYFAAILYPVPTEPENLSAEWITNRKGVIFNPDVEKNSGDENIAILLETDAIEIGSGSTKDFKFQLYLGPKDKTLFEENELYNKLGFINVIDFRACFGNLFRPLSFMVLAIMKSMYGVIGNYGVVIIIFVLVIRIVLHPITKKSQISMMKMSKLAPQAEEIKKKYANNKAEQQKQMMALYKEQGASPVLGCLPMLLQMPIWIALYSAIYASVDLRGAAFLPFWITDLSAPDALFSLPAATETIPFIGSFLGTSFNLLPILLGISMFLQQKLMSSSSASASSQAAQQQKMMMWMMPIMMLLFLYRAPSGLNLYIMASTAGGVFEQYVIRKHIREKEAREAIGLVSVTSKTGGKLKKKKPKPPFKTM